MTSDQILTVLQNTATPVSHDSVGTIDVCRAVADVLEKDDSVCDGSEL